MAVPRAAINHIGLQVPNLEEAIAFYEKVMGWVVISQPMTITNDGTSRVAFSEMVYGHKPDSWKSFRIAQMVGGNDVGIELLEHEENHQAEHLFDYKEYGIFHYAITVPDVKEFVDRFVDAGGETWTPIMLEYPRFQNASNKINTQYVKDPFGNVFEVHNMGYLYLNSYC